VQKRTAFVGRQRGPAGFLECLLGGGDGGIDVAGVEIRHGGELFAGTRIVRLERFAVGGVRFLAADPRLLQRLIEEFADFGQ
jgi:hypothetical protein